MEFAFRFFPPSSPSVASVVHLSLGAYRLLSILLSILEAMRFCPYHSTKHDDIEFKYCQRLYSHDGMCRDFFKIFLRCVRLISVVSSAAAVDSSTCFVRSSRRLL